MGQNPKDKFIKESLGEIKRKLPKLSDEEMESILKGVQELLQRRLDGADVAFAVYLAAEDHIAGRLVGSGAIATKFAEAAIENAIRGSEDLDDGKGPGLPRRVAVRLAECAEKALKEVKNA